MAAEESLIILDTVLRQERLSNIQELVFCKVWEGRTYAEIADIAGYDPDYIKRVGSQLWRSLSKTCGEKVTKSNLHSVLRRHWPKIEEKPKARDTGLRRRSSDVDRDRQGNLHLLSSIRTDWGEAAEISTFYGRTLELTVLEQWLISDHCHLVALLGMGGIGKTALAVKLAKRVQSQFNYVVWRSLRNAPPLKEILSSLIKFLSHEQETKLPETIDGKLLRLIDYLRNSRCLIILDNAESLLRGNRAGCYREGYQEYGELLRCLGETSHQSCVLLTSREKPKEIALLEDKTSPVRSLQLSGLKEAEAQQIFQEKELTGTEASYQLLIKLYSGNPLALKIASNTIRELFNGNAAEFLAEGTPIFGDIYDLLEQQFNRLSPVEKQIMYWLAINQEWMSLAELREDLLPTGSRRELIEAIEALSRRPIIEKNANRFTQQPVIMEYTTERLIDEVCTEIVAELEKSQEITHCRLNTHALIKARAKDYIRDSQTRLILEPTLNKLRAIFKSDKEVEKQLKKVLLKLQTAFSASPGYGGGNLLNLLSQLKVDLTGYNFSNLTIWQAYLQDVNLHDTNFTDADLNRSVFTETFGGILSVAFRCDGQILATGDTESAIRLWQVSDGKQLLTCKGHSSWVWSVSFSPDGQLLASGSEDKTVKLWDASTGQCLKTFHEHHSAVLSVAFMPDQQTLFSGSKDQTIKLWDIKTGQCLKTLQGHTGAVWSVAISPDAQTLVSSSADTTVKLWDIQTGQCLKTFQGHKNWVKAVAFSSDNQTIASGSHDQTIKLWDIKTGQCLKTLVGHSDSMFKITFSPDGQTLASASCDHTVRLWNVNTGECLKTLQGHTNRVWSVVFSPNGETLVSGGDDHAAKFWNVKTGQCLKTLQGHTNAVLANAFHPKGTMIASGNEDQTIRLWDVESGKCLKVFQGHTNRVWSVVFSPDGQTLLSGSGDRLIKLWNVKTGECLKTFSGHTSWIWSVVFSPNVQTLASSSQDATIRMWDLKTGECLHVLQGHASPVFSVIFSPQGKTLISGGSDSMIKLWDTHTGQCLQTLQGHTSEVLALALSRDGQTLVSGSGDHTVKLWNIHTGQCLQTLNAHTSRVWSVAFSPDGQVLASGSEDKTLKLWDTKTGQCLKTLQGHHNILKAIAFSPAGQTLVTSSFDETMKVWDVKTGQCLKILRVKRPYEGMNITGVNGLTDAQKATLKALGAIEFSKRD